MKTHTSIITYKYAVKFGAYMFTERKWSLYVQIMTLLKTVLRCGMYVIANHKIGSKACSAAIISRYPGCIVGAIFIVAAQSDHRLDALVTQVFHKPFQ